MDARRLDQGNEARTASSVIDAAAEMLGMEPGTPLKAQLQQDGVRWAWQMVHIEASQWDRLGVSLGLQTAIKDVLASCGGKATAGQSGREEQVPNVTPPTTDALAIHLSSLLAAESPQKKRRSADRHKTAPRRPSESELRMREMVLRDVTEWVDGARAARREAEREPKQKSGWVFIRRAIFQERVAV